MQPKKNEKTVEVKVVINNSQQQVQKQDQTVAQETSRRVVMVASKEAKETKKTNLTPVFLGVTVEED